MAFELTIVGSNSAIPSHGRHPTAQVLNVNEDLYLIDCGDGTQIRLDHFDIRKFRITKIFISHLHGDHVYGLPGLLTTMNLLGRERPMDIFGPPGVRDFLQCVFSFTGVDLKYPVTFSEDTGTGKSLILENDDLKVFSIPLDHRVPTRGYIFEQKPGLRHLDGRKADEMNIPFEWRGRLKRGEDYVDEQGRLVIRSTEITRPADPPSSYAFCSDTKYDPRLADLVRGVDWLYHEATFSHDMAEVAADRFHSTAKQAAQLARDADVGRLIIGHISSRYSDYSVLLEEARKVFPQTFGADEGRVFDLSVLRP